MARKSEGKDSNGNDNYQGVLYDFSQSDAISTEMTDYGQGTEENREPDMISTDYNTSYNNGQFSKDTLQQEYNEMINSIKKYGGFYVGRYETSLSDATSTSVGTSGIPQSKKGVIPTSAANSATIMWYGLYSKEKEYVGTNNSVQSSMIWGSQYDAMLNWIIGSNSADKAKIVEDCNASHDLNNIYSSGEEENDKINNIYDLEGNLQEWTLEADTSYFRVLRGGDCRHSYFPAFRYKDNSYNRGIDKSAYYGGRLTLYIR